MNHAHAGRTSPFFNILLVRILPSWKVAGLEQMAMWIVLPDNRAIPPKVRVFIDFITARLQSQNTN
jgi:DNA-binding transcriptional LysR family regulator